MPKLGKKGFSLIEVLVVIALMSIMMLIAGYYIGNRSAKAQLKSAASELVSNMTLARIRAIRDTRPWAIEFPNATSYIVYSHSGEDYAPEDPADPVHWNNGNEEIFRSISLPANITFASNQNGLDSNPVADPVSYNTYIDPDGTPKPNLLIFDPNGSTSEAGEVYLTIPSGETFCVSNLRATGRVKAQRNYGSGWSK